MKKDRRKEEQEDNGDKIGTIIEVEAKSGGFTKIYVQHEDADKALELFDAVRKRLGESLSTKRSLSK